jgi:hypothetical protein
MPAPEPDIVTPSRQFDERLIDRPNLGSGGPSKHEPDTGRLVERPWFPRVAGGPSRALPQDGQWSKHDRQNFIPQNDPFEFF